MTEGNTKTATKRTTVEIYVAILEEVVVLEGLDNEALASALLFGFTYLYIYIYICFKHEEPNKASLHL